ncbi:MAG TPA: hypothetical protein VNT79_02410 [Phycisphaerae bacterium]|nr:hypothetical protein [Phycisphaerae bacterium]
MSFTGRVHNGTVVFDQPLSLNDGTLVRVEPLAESTASNTGNPEALRPCDARWAGDPTELDALLAEVQQLRESDLSPIDES